jgi:hypothetical protein
MDMYVGMNLARLRLVNPADTSVLGGKLSNTFCLDVHTSSAYMVAPRYLNQEAFKRLLSLEI